MLIKFELLASYLLLLAQIANPFKIAKYYDTAVEKVLYYLITNGYAKEILNEETVLEFGFNNDSCVEISKIILSEFKKGQSISLISKVNLTPDEIMRVELLKINALQANMLESFTQICTGCKNPAVIFWRDELLLCSEFYYQQNILLFARLKFFGDSTLIVEESTNRLGITTVFGSYGHIGGIELAGNDCRMTTTVDREVIALFSLEHKFRPMRLGYAKIVFNTQNETLIVKEHHKTLQTEFDVEVREFQGRQKNWVPFLYNDTIYFIQRINPMHVLRVDSSVDPTDWANSDLRMKIVSAADIVTIPWNYGEIRGGTNAILIDDFYLAFFHSRHYLPYNGNRITYFMGAYTFSCRPPFTLLSISPQPIIHETLYSGAWFSRRGAQSADYVVFPTSFFVRENVIYLFLGHNDDTGYLTKLKLHVLLQSLVQL